MKNTKICIIYFQSKNISHYARLSDSYYKASHPTFCFIQIQKSHISTTTSLFICDQPLEKIYYEGQIDQKL